MNDTTHINLLNDASYVLDASSRVWARPGYIGIAYNDGDDTETRIFNSIKNSQDVSVLSAELRGQCLDWPSLYHLSTTRANILRPANRFLSGDILEIGAGCGAITRYLGETNANVLALEGSPRRAAIARERTRDLSNVCVVSERFSDFNSKQKFDVITLIGVFEYANLFTPTDNPPTDMLSRVYSMLKPDGVLLLAIENKLGLKYFAGGLEDHTGVPMFGIEGRYKQNTVSTYGRSELRDILNKSGFVHSEFLGCFPDYKLPSSIVTTEGFKNRPFDSAALASQSTAKDQLKPNIRCFSPELVWPSVTANGMGLDLSNSFLVIASPATMDLLDPCILAFHYSSDRRQEFCKESIFKADPDHTINIHYQSLTLNRPELKSKTNHDDSTLYFSVPNTSPYTFGSMMSYKFISLVSSPEWKESVLKSFWQDYLDVITRLSNSTTAFSGHTKIDGSLIDCVPNNLIRKENGSHEFIDTEWRISGDVAPEWLLLRAILGVILIPTNFAADEAGKNYTYAEFITKCFQLCSMQITRTELENWLRKEIRLQEAIIGVSQDTPGRLLFLDEALPSSKYYDLIPSYRREVAELSAKLNDLLTSRKWRWAKTISESTPTFIRKLARYFIQ